MLGEDHRHVELPKQRNKSWRFEAIVSDFHHVTQRMSIERVGQQFEKAAEIRFVIFLEWREQPEEGAEAGAELCDARGQEMSDRIAGFLEHAAVYCIAGTLYRKNKSLGHLGSPFAKGRRSLGTVENAVDLDRGQMLPSVFEFSRMRQPFGIEDTAPGLIGPTSYPGVYIALPLCHADVMSGV